MKVIIDIPTNPNEEVIYRNGVSFCGGFRAKVETAFLFVEDLGQK